MWPILLLVCTIPRAISQTDSYRDNRLDWHVKLNVPGDAGSDYPTFSAIPRTDFSCRGREPGYYADQQANCQVFRVCTAGTANGFQSFLCPNGTLFNQAVFVCDWWMNVNCGKAEEIQNIYNERFVNLKPGPHLMQDVRKMITHPMRNPINNGLSQNELVSPQTYRPQVYTSSHTNDNNLHVPSRGSFGNIYENLSNDISFAASTASPQYRQYKQNQDIHTTQFSFNQRPQNDKTELRNNPFITTPTNEYIRRANENQLTALNNRNAKVNNYDNNKETHFESYKINHVNQLPRETFHDRNNNPINIETQQNLVSSSVPPTIISKTIAFKSLIPGDSPGSPKSRITFKTWILKPKSGKLIVKPSYPNKNSIPSASEQTSASSDPYFYDKPKPSLELSTITSAPEIAYTSPTTFRPSRLYLDPTDSTEPTPQQLNQISTLKPPDNAYLPPTDTETLSRQYLSPIRSPRVQSDRNERLLTASSSQTPQYELLDTNNYNLPLYTVTKQVKVNTNHNNQTFTDVLTKEKIDITVSDIIKNTNKVVKSNSKRNNVAQLRSNSQFFDKNKPTFNGKVKNREELTSTSPTSTKSSKLISIPSIHLQPPYETSNEISANKFSNLPYYSEPVNTIERTVSIKITIPEKIARILFKNNSSPEDFEILNTGSSNYLVYANNLASKTGSEPTPVGKLSLNKYSNISNSQDLVFSFLADSLNAAKNYNNIAKQSITTTVTPIKQLSNYRYNNADDITSKISQLTSTQFNNIHRYNNKHPFTAPPQALAPQNAYYQQREQSTPSKVWAGTARPPNTNRLQNVRQYSNQIYSGQLYQLPVPEVTRDYYNLPNIKSNQKTIPRTKSAASLRTSEVFEKENGPDIESIRSQQLQFTKNEQSSKQDVFTTQQEPDSLRSFLTSTNGITAQVQDSIKGSLTHPSDSDKLLTYKKDQSYYVFSQLNGEHENNRINEVSNEKSRYGNLNLPFVPSLAYDEKQKQRLVSSLQANVGVPRASDDRYSNRLGISTNVDYTVNHPSSASYIPSQSQGNKNLKIEDLDSNERSGYPKISPQPIFNT